MSGQLEDAVFVYTSEHGLRYESTFYEDAVQIPMVVAAPGLPAAGTVETPVGYVAPVHTILVGRRRPPDPRRGHSPEPLVEGRPGAADPPGYAHTEGNVTGPSVIRAGDWTCAHAA